MTGRVVLITGASAGVGRAAARAFAAAGDDVALLARGAAGLEAAAKDVEAAGRRVVSLPCDVADPNAVDDAASAAEAALGPIDVWVNNAFSSVFAPFTDITMEEFRRTTEVTYLGFVHGTKAALDRMLPRDQGVIVQVGSALAHRAIPLQSAYCGAKHAIVGFTESLRCELMHEGSNVRVTMVHMPALDTPQFSWVLSRLPRRPQPVPPIFEPEVAGRAIVHAAAHPQRREWWVGGPTAATILANRVIPGVLDRYLARTGYDSQQTAQPAAAGQTGNLWHARDEHDDHGAHGDFGERAHRRSWQWWLTTHRTGVIGTVTAAAVARAAARRRGG